MQAIKLVHNAADAAFAVDQELRVVAWNRQAEALLGYTAAEVMGRPCYEVLRAVLPQGEPLCTPDCPARACFGRCTPFAAGRCLTPTRDGRWVPVSLSTVFVPSSKRVSALVFVRPLEGEAPDLPGNTTLRVFTLGQFGLAVGERSVPLHRWERKQALTLLKYLVHHRGHPVHRERLIESLWPDAPEQRGRERLKVTVHYLRQRLREAGLEGEVLATLEESYLLRREALWVDADAFLSLVWEGDRLARRGEARQALERYREAEGLYRGDYMEEDPYSDWFAEERERLREVYLGCVERMARLYIQQGDYPQAAQALRKALVIEPCRESLHRLLMRSLWLEGRRSEALAQYHTCVRTLARELGVPPMPETTRLYQEIVGSSRAAAL